MADIDSQTTLDNGNVHRAAAKIIVSKSRAARGSVCNVLLSGVTLPLGMSGTILFPLVKSDQAREVFGPILVWPR